MVKSMTNVIVTLLALAVAIPVMMAMAIALRRILPPRPIRGMAVLVPMFLFLMVTRCTGLLETIGINSEQALYGVLLCGMSLVFLDGFAGRLP